MTSERAARGGRLLAIDYGERRVGLAVSDPEGIIASPAGFIVRRAGKRPPVAELVRRAEELEARGFVLGLPLDDQGEETPRSTEVRAVAAELEKRTGLPTRLVDERYTTAAALRAVREMGGSTRGRKGDVDSLAAAMLLQHALQLAPTAAGAAATDDRSSDDSRAV
ncbi:MAG TPA: Holliday junction resolvase RuvX [Gemmatimonadaceae bacterium]|nr:Holliday junction resolvase RuvX [Gemmatimonadaceae bacterium]